MTLGESVRLYVAGKRSFDGCGFRSGCPVASAHSCDTVNHAVVTHAHRRLHGHGTHADMPMLQTIMCVCVHFLALSHRATSFFLLNHVILSCLFFLLL